MLDLIKERDKAWARMVGAAANLAFQLSGGMAGNLDKVTLTLGKHELEVAFAPEIQDLMSDTVKKRVEGLGETYKAFSKIAK